MSLSSSMLQMSKMHSSKPNPLLALTKSIHIDEDKVAKFTNSIHSYINDDVRNNFTPASNQYDQTHAFKITHKQEPEYSIKGKYPEKVYEAVGYEHNEQTSTLDRTGGDFKKFPRMQDQINDNPGPGAHNVSRNLNFETGKTFPESIDYQVKNNNPAPNQYNPQNADVLINKAAPSFSMKGAVYNGNRDNFPGPGQYAIDKSLTLTQSLPASYSFPKQNSIQTVYQTPGPQDYADFSKKQMSRSQISNRYREFTKEPSPGVGTYNIDKSTLKSSGAGKFGGKSFQRTEVNPTGPGQYDISREHRIPGGAMGKQSRDTKISNNPNIGPGRYNIPENQPRAASIGIRSQLSVRNEGPGPNAYHMKSSLKKGQKSIGIKPKSFGNPFPIREDEPGPSDYQLNKNKTSKIIQNSTFSKQSREQHTETIGKGPATYNIRAEDQQGGATMRFRQYGFTL